jgi:hypothetical protein
VKPVTAAFLAAVPRSHDVVFRCDVLLGGQTIATDLPVEAGDVVLDRRAAIRGSATFVVPGLEWVPTGATSPLAPAGQEARIWAGIAQAGGPTDELVSLGVFRIDETGAADDGDVTSQVDAPDRAAAVVDASILAPHHVPEGTNYATAIRDLIAGGVSGLTYRFTPTAFVVPPGGLTWVEGDDRWQRAVEMAAACGMELFFDGDGVCVLQPEPTLTGDPVAELAEGTDGILVTAQRRWSRRGRKNGVLVVVENSSLPVPLRVLVVDDAPGSVTQWDGQFGNTVELIRTSLPSDVTQATEMARARLASLVGIVTQMEGAAVPHFALEPSDVVRVRRVALGIDEVNILESVRLPLDPEGTMAFTTRARQVVAA